VSSQNRSEWNKQKATKRLTKISTPRPKEEKKDDRSPAILMSTIDRVKPEEEEEEKEYTCDSDGGSEVGRLC
jgi:hypothetical protein